MEATGTGVGRLSKLSVLSTPGLLLLSPLSTWFFSAGSSQSRLGGDLLSLIVVPWGVGEGGKPIRGVRVLSRKVVLSEAGNVVVSMRVTVEGRRSCGGWVGVVEEIFSRLLG